MFSDAFSLNLNIYGKHKNFERSQEVTVKATKRKLWSEEQRTGSRDTVAKCVC